MRRSSVDRSLQASAGLVTALMLATVIMSAQAVSLHAQPMAGSHSPLAYDKAHEITLNGTIQEVVPQAPIGSPAGVHLMVAGPDGTVDAHLGPYMTSDTMQALQAGIPVQVVGVMQKVGGQQYLLARQVIFSGRQVTVRSANGFLLEVQRPRTSRGAFQKATAAESNGGAR